MLRTLVGAGGTVAPATGTAGARDGSATATGCRDRSPTPRPPATRGERGTDAGVADPPRAKRYVATVDRIVDGAHVVILLEERATPVDQLVVDADAHDGLEAGDILLAVVADDELLAYRSVPERPSGGVDT